jgi:2'-5' RNA ligase
VGTKWVTQAAAPFERLGYPPEQRAFTPHVTLGRSKSAGGSAVLREILAAAEPLPQLEMTVDRVVLFESKLRPTGAEYTPRATVPLAAG